jgi:transglutaminase-like putative cysteine protease
MTTRPLLLLASLTALTGAALQAAAQTPPAARTVRLSYTATVRDIPPGADVLDLWLPVPQTDSHQTVHETRVTAPGAVTLGREPRNGTLALHLRLTQPKAPVTARWEVLVTRRENAGRREALTPAETAAYLAAEPLVPLDGPVRAFAEEAVRGKRGEAAKARALYEKVTATLKYDKSGTGWGRGDALFACDAKRGNCTDFHALLIGAARSQGIPARFAIGLSLPETGEGGEIAGYHCWAELYVRGEWVPVDSSEAAKALAQGDTAKKDYFYGHHDAHRVELSRGRHLTLRPAQKAGPLNFFVYPYAEVDGRKHEGVDRAVRFEVAGPA